MAKLIQMTYHPLGHLKMLLCKPKLSKNAMIWLNTCEFIYSWLSIYVVVISLPQFISL